MIWCAGHKHGVADLPPSNRRRLALSALSTHDVELSAEALSTAADVRVLAMGPRLAILEGLAVGISRARPHAVRSICVSDASFLSTAAALADVARVGLKGCDYLTDVSALVAPPGRDL